MKELSPHFKVGYAKGTLEWVLKLAETANMPEWGINHIKRALAVMDMDFMEELDSLSQPDER